MSRYLILLTIVVTIGGTLGATIGLFAAILYIGSH